MFARLLELNVRVEKRTELLKKVREEIIPTLKRQIGYMDMVVLENDLEPHRPFVITLWQTKLDMERYEKEAFPKVRAILDHFLYVPPLVKHCKVEETLTGKMMEAVAA
jgi:heme-degrading monooxygenase HmoA